MNVFDTYLIGEIDSINWGFDSSHLNQRLHENGIGLDYIQDMIFKKEPVDHAYVGNNRYEVFFETSKTNEYEELKFIFACGIDSIEVITVMPNNSIGTNKNRTRFYPEDQKKLKKLQAKAYSKRRMH